MADPILLSDEEDDRIVLCTPTPARSRKRRVCRDGRPEPPPTVLVVDDDPTPQKPAPASASASTPSFVAETPMSDVAIVRCTARTGSGSGSLGDRARAPEAPPKCSGISGLIFLESDNESDGFLGSELWKANQASFASHAVKDFGHGINVVDSTDSHGGACPAQLPCDVYTYQVHDCPDKENFGMEQVDNEPKHPTGSKSYAQEKDSAQQMDWKSNCQSKAKQNAQKKDDANKAKNKKTDEEKIRMKEEKKRKKEEAKLQQAIMKAEAAELKKLHKEKQKWEKGKFALKSIVAEIDAKVVEMGSIGGHLLSRFTDKGLTFRIKANPIERSILWTMTVPEHLSQLCPKETVISYITLVYEAEEFCNLVSSGSLFDHLNGIRSLYPSHTVCYLTNRLMAYINKREQQQYKNPASNGWQRPPVEEALARMTTHFARVHSRQCIDEPEVAEHIVGLTCSLASCQYRKKLSWLSVNANGSIIPTGSLDRSLIKNNCWLKALMAVPKVQPRFAVAIWKKYPTMRSLLNVYMDPDKTVHEKEFHLKDLTTEGLLGEDRRLGEVCSKRVYRIFMAQSSGIRTDDVEDGADFFAT
ncbi:crossover junction endonuclease EME1B-like isoform X2 [Syzygium oleosum]|uniref:crossover junction endonuclease EME1B-like isoform X2 n=1 Tax=Syzygium oleosum TaxID=219896 RepID=UPI0011D1A52B|nr:crossover junction endonuclease EME1B-like isoform X2 [Syzygium oleosum]